MVGGREHTHFQRRCLTDCGSRVGRLHKARGRITKWVVRRAALAAVAPGFPRQAEESPLAARVWHPDAVPELLSRPFPLVLLALVLLGLLVWLPRRVVP